MEVRSEQSRHGTEKQLCGSGICGSDMERLARESNLPPFQMPGTAAWNCRKFAVVPGPVSWYSKKGKFGGNVTATVPQSFNHRKSIFFFLSNSGGSATPRTYSPHTFFLISIAAASSHFVLPSSSHYSNIDSHGVLATCLIALTAYLTKATQGRKASFDFQSRWIWSPVAETV